MKRTPSLIALALAALSMAGCSTDPGDAQAPTVVVMSAGGPMMLGEFDLNQLEFEEITGSLQPGQAGIMGRELTTWPRNCYFGINVPPGAIADPVDFMMRIPTQASYEQYAEEIGEQLIILLEPDGEHFLTGLTIYATWMPWLGAPPEPLEFSSGTSTGQANVTYLPQTRRYRVTFKVDHFSDWRVRPIPPIASGEEPQASITW